MKIVFPFVLALLFSIPAFAQLPVDKSPLDVSYCPDNFPLAKIQGKETGPLVARIIFSRPHVNGRTIFGDLIDYGKVWRLGANEATEIEFFQPVKINGSKIKKGRYTMYAIPDSLNWNIIINKDTDLWGSFKYDQSMDVVRINVPIEKLDSMAEFFSANFEKTQSGYNLVFMWENVRASMPFSL